MKHLRLSAAEKIAVVLGDKSMTVLEINRAVAKKFGFVSNVYAAVHVPQRFKESSDGKFSVIPGVSMRASNGRKLPPIVPLEKFVMFKGMSKAELAKKENELRDQFSKLNAQSQKLYEQIALIAEAQKRLFI